MVILLVVDIALVLVYPSIALKFTTSTPLPKISKLPSPSCSIPVSLSPIARKTLLPAGVPPGVTPPNPNNPFAWMRSLSLTVSPPAPEPLKIIFDVILPAFLLFCITRSLSDAEAAISCLVTPAPLRV